MARRVGVFGGTFDPPHLGHVAVAAAAARQCALDEVWFTPAVAYHKGDGVTPARHRVAMCAAAAREAPVPASVCTVDVDRGVPTFTVDTLSELTAAHPDVEFVFVAGSDVVASMLSWGTSAQECLDLATFAAAHRPGFPAPRLPAPLRGRLEVFDTPELIEVSSSLVRARLAAGVDVDDLVGVDVAAYIDRHDLYRPVPATV
jgi:nicotinate-nucleotide adenylyltransferase